MRQAAIDFPYEHRGETVRIRASGYYNEGRCSGTPDQCFPPEGECNLEAVTVNGKTISFDDWEDEEGVCELECQFIIDEFFRKLRED